MGDDVLYYQIDTRQQMTDFGRALGKAYGRVLEEDPSSRHIVALFASAALGKSTLSLGMMETVTQRPDMICAVPQDDLMQTWRGDRPAVTNRYAEDDNVQVRLYDLVASHMRFRLGMPSFNSVTLGDNVPELDPDRGGVDIVEGAFRLFAVVDAHKPYGPTTFLAIQRAYHTDTPQRRYITCQPSDALVQHDSAWGEFARSVQSLSVTKDVIKNDYPAFEDSHFEL